MKLISDWYHIDQLLPLPGYSVLVAKLMEDKTMLTGVGRLVVADDKTTAGWFCTEDGNLKIITARRYWISLLEKETVVPSNATDEELSVILNTCLKKLSFFEPKFQALAAAMMQAGKGTYPIDYYISGILTRGLSLIYGYETLINTKNYLSAAHLVRLLLDNYLRLYALWLVNDPDNVANQVWGGTPLRAISDRDGKKMRDDYLCAKASEIYPWISDVYNEASGFIHFSNKHIMSATMPAKEKEMTLETYVGKFDHNVTNLSRIEATACMIEICNCICDAVFGWIDTKRLQKLPDDTSPI